MTKQNIIKRLFILVFVFLNTTLFCQNPQDKKHFDDDTYYMTFLPKIERLCGIGSASRTNNCFEFYFTKKGSVIYKWYSPIEGEAWFYYGTYFLTDTGISYTTTNLYYVKVKYDYQFEKINGHLVDKRVDTTNYNKGKLKKIKPFEEFIYKNNCKEFPYAIAPENYTKRIMVTINTPHTIPPGSVFETNDRQKEILTRKIKTIKIFEDL
jgi:hypothetical protein